MEIILISQVVKIRLWGPEKAFIATERKRLNEFTVPDVFNNQTGNNSVTNSNMIEVETSELPTLLLSTCTNIVTFQYNECVTTTPNNNA